ncbi:MAG: hypothetical protein IPM48_00965 [Saprospiraceae bacterium]|nr:hypothetical protein [Saprospiraceae bacterium]
MKNFDSIAVQSTIENVKCFGEPTGGIKVTPISGTAPFFYYWSSGQTLQDLSDVQAGNYILYLRDVNNCQKELQYTITSPDLLIASVQTKSSTGQDGEAKAFVSGGIPPYAYSWSTGASTDEIKDLAPGDYQLTVTDENLCERIIQFSIVSTVGVFDDQMNEGIRIFPNPFSDHLEIIFGQYAIHSIVIKDVLGREIGVYRISENVNIWKIQTDQLLPGHYLLEFKWRNGKQKYAEVIKM